MFPLIPLVISLVPQLTKWLFGDKAAATVTQVTAVVHSLTGSTDPATVSAAIAGDAALANQITLQLAQIAAAREQEADATNQAALVSTLSDIASARSQTVALAAAKSPIAWGAPVVSTVVLLTFGLMLGMILSHTLPAGSEALANVMLGTLAAMATSVCGYWVGSSAGSARKSDDLARAQDQLANSVPASATAPLSAASAA
jgi:hypothetical protein